MEKKITKILSEPNNIIHKLPIFDFEILLCLNEKIIPNGRKIIKYGNPSFTNDSNKLKSFSLISSNSSDLPYGNNSQMDFYCPHLFHTNQAHDETTGLIDTESLDNDSQYWLPNTYHNISKSLILR